MKRKVLVIDDREVIVFLFKRFLSQQGFDVSTVCSYYDAMAKMAIADFDLVLTDIELGEGKTGIDILKEVQRTNPTCPVIFCTGNPDSMDVSEARRMGAYDCIYKPVKLETLSHSINMALRGKTVFDKLLKT
ncbi:response regulator [Candidatus Scalindua japonica]|uniref:Response regulator n=1 Tax=Candidatus Scalindua japonica TaxID=1284222 RepID=A0A286TW25_9BACT|nr:response regulator [Candidatus Scalindua japonica]GAX60093.1 response regulator [Candidatus Scalindua japonica]